MTPDTNDRGPGSHRFQLPELYRGMSASEVNYHRAMYYLAGALWSAGAACEALAALNELVDKSQVVNRDSDRAQ